MPSYSIRFWTFGSSVTSLNSSGNAFFRSLTVKLSYLPRSSIALRRKKLKLNANRIFELKLIFKRKMKFWSWKNYKNWKIIFLPSNFQKLFWFSTCILKSAISCRKKLKKYKIFCIHKMKIGPCNIGKIVLQKLNSFFS